MYLIDKRTKEYFNVSEDNQDFLLALVNKLDLTQEFENFIYNGLDRDECKALALLIRDNISANRVFQSLEVRNPVPVIVDDDNKPLLCCQCLNMELLSFLSMFSKFIDKCRFGFRTEL